MADVIYNSFVYDVATGAIDLNTDTFKAMLVSGYTPNKDTHTKRSDVTSEITGTGYTAGGATLASVTVTNDTANDVIIFDAADTAWANATLSATGAVIYKSRGGASSADELVCFKDFGGTVSSTAAAFTIQWAATGIVRFSNT